MEQHIQLLLDYFEGRGIFRAVEEYTGMAASASSEVFFDYFAALDRPAQQDIVRLTVKGAIGEIELLIPYILETTILLSEFCIYNYDQYVAAEKEQLEREYDDPTNCEHWINDNEDEILHTGIAFKQTWRYALILWTILYKLNSDSAIRQYAYLLTNARSMRFKHALTSNKEYLDSQGLTR